MNAQKWIDCLRLCRRRYARGYAIRIKRRNAFKPEALSPQSVDVNRGRSADTGTLVCICEAVCTLGEGSAVYVTVDPEWHRGAVAATRDTMRPLL